jgi:hypothetical protein
MAQAARQVSPGLIRHCFPLGFVQRPAVAVLGRWCDYGGGGGGGGGTGPLVAMSMVKVPVSVAVRPSTASR